MAEPATLESIASSIAAVQDRLAKLEERPSRSRSQDRESNGRSSRSGSNSLRPSRSRSPRGSRSRDGCSKHRRHDDSLVRSKNTSPRHDKSPLPARTHWADRDDERMDYHTQVMWPDDLETECSHLTEVSNSMRSLLIGSFAALVSNTTRREWKKGHIVPNVDSTKCPKLDPVVKELGSQTKSADSELARIQTLMLDAVGPLADLLEQPEVTRESLTESVGQALRYLGNAGANLSRMRRKKVLKDLNPDLLSLADQAETFADAPPLLFGQGFAKKVKDHSEEVRSLRKAAPSSSKSFFRGGRPSRGGTWRGGRNQPFHESSSHGRNRQWQSLRNQPNNRGTQRGRGPRNQEL